MSNSPDDAKKGCIGQKGKCPHPVLAKEMCQAHYRKHLRKGDITGEVRSHNSSLISISIRLSAAAVEELDRQGGRYAKGGEVVEEWAQAQLAKRKKAKPEPVAAQGRIASGR